MRECGLWAALVDRAQRLCVWGPRRDRRTRWVRSTWQTCRRCGSQSYLRAAGDRLCGGCRSLH